MSTTTNKAHQSITNPCTIWKCGPRELVEIELGARYRRLLLEATIDSGERDDASLEAELDANNERFGVHDLHDELTSAKEELALQMQLLAAARYTVEEPRQTPSGGWYFHTRKPKPGDLVMVPNWFAGTGRDEAEPEEERIGKDRADEEAMFRSPRNDPKETHGEWLTLADILDHRNAFIIARLTDKTQLKSRVEAALTVLREHGPISIDGTLRRMCDERRTTWYDLLRLAEVDDRKVKPKYKPGFLHIIRRGIRVWVEIPHKEFVANQYRVTTWHAIPENPIAD